MLGSVFLKKLHKPFYKQENTLLWFKSGRKQKTCEHLQFCGLHTNHSAITSPLYLIVMLQVLRSTDKAKLIIYKGV